jgi:hypothetical protein
MVLLMACYLYQSFQLFVYTNQLIRQLRYSENMERVSITEGAWRPELYDNTQNTSTSICSERGRYWLVLCRIITEWLLQYIIVIRDWFEPIKLSLTSHAQTSETIFNLKYLFGSKKLWHNSKKYNTRKHKNIKFYFSWTTNPWIKYVKFLKGNLIE